MGVDIMGINPIRRSPKPESPDWNTATQEQKDTYFEVSDKWQEENPGDYFRSNWWGWRPIVTLADFVNSTYNLNLDLSGWGSNSADGLKSEYDCKIMADALENLLYESTQLEEDSDTIYLNLGTWVSWRGSFLSDEENEKLNEEYPVGTMFYSSIVDDRGKLVRTAYRASLSHVKRFISFLRECGGFEIW